MSLFQTSVVKKYLNELNPELIDKKYTDFQTYFNNPEIQQNIRESKEEEYQSGFVSALFVNILGYTLKPDPNYNFVLEKKNIDDSKKADGAILKDNEVIAIIELKSTQTTDLDTVETQAFGYKNHNPKCRYVITSNFEKIRLYIQHAVDHIEFDLFNLTREDFTLLWLCFLKDNVLQDIPLKIKESSVLQEENVTKKLYNDYSKFREEIFNNIVKNNPEYDKLVLFKKTQKLLDRFLFIFFAEDRLLVPPNSINQIVEKWKDDVDFGDVKPLYSIFKQYFHVLNVGRPKSGKRQEIFPYNGGLFLNDEILDSIKIDDDILHKHTLNLSTYDFETEVDVNILGHIFEHSLGEIENVQAEIKGEEVDKQKTRRKKDGIFYTPKYITKYIVENTIGKLCEEKRKELEIIDEEYAKGRKNRKKDLIRKLDHKLDEYRNWLLDITILDPACGSGAFLNQALEFLIQEHGKVDELKYQLLGGSIKFPDIEDKILEKNIYGVDLNEESVEIAKLSLWLRTAQKGRKLTTLSNHIKCGNSLIDDPEIAGEKAFNWQNEFPEVFAKGGFDVVIGNPPYVRVQQINYETIDFLKKKYNTAYKRIDISLCFIELSKYIIKVEKGITSFITSNQFLTTEYGQEMRSFLLDAYNLVECIDFGDLPIFSEALTYVSIFTLKNSKNSKFTYYHIDNINDAISNLLNNPQVIELKNLSNDNWNLKYYTIANIWKNVFSDCISISEIGNAWYGVISGNDSIFMFDKNRYENTNIEKELLKPLLRAQNCSKYYCSESENYILYPYKLEDNKTTIIAEDELKNKYPNAYNYLLTHRTELEKRKDSRATFKDRTDWYGLIRFGQLNVFKKPKIVTPGEVKDHKFCIDNSQASYSGARVFGITLDNESFSLNYILCILNSYLIKKYLQSISSLKQGGFYSYSSNVLNKIPIKKIHIKDQKTFIDLSSKISKLSSELNSKKTKFTNRLKSIFENLNISSKLEQFYKLEFKDFIKELSKQKIKLSLSKQDEWEEYFNSYKTEINKLQSDIDKTDKEINQMVYELYGLTEEEIKIVEENTK